MSDTLPNLDFHWLTAGSHELGYFDGVSVDEVVRLPDVLDGNRRAARPRVDSHANSHPEIKSEMKWRRMREKCQLKFCCTVDPTSKVHGRGCKVIPNVRSDFTRSHLLVHSKITRM